MIFKYFKILKNDPSLGIFVFLCIIFYTFTNFYSIKDSWLLFYVQFFSLFHYCLSLAHQDSVMWAFSGFAVFPCTAAQLAKCSSSHWASGSFPFLFHPWKMVLQWITGYKDILLLLNRFLKSSGEDNGLKGLNTFMVLMCVKVLITVRLHRWTVLYACQFLPVLEPEVGIWKLVSFCFAFSFVVLILASQMYCVNFSFMVT